MTKILLQLVLIVELQSASKMPIQTFRFVRLAMATD